MKRSLCLSILTCLAIAAGLQAVELQPNVERGAMMSDMYQVSVGGQKVDVYGARTADPPFAGPNRNYGGPYSFVNLEADGPVEVTVTSERDLRSTVLRPARPEVKMTVVDDHTLKLQLPGPTKFSVEPDGKESPLLLFANPPETNIPKEGDPNVVYFGPGIHEKDSIKLRDNQTLYLAPGAILKGGIVAEGKNITIRGRGILDGSDWAWRKGPGWHVISIYGSNVTVEGITIRGAWHWTLVPMHSDHVTVQNVKICGGRVQNDDGINPCNSQDVLIKDCFIRSDDDCVAMKGMKFKDGANNNVERITVEDTILWCDRARIFLLGHESRAEYMRDIKLQNLDIVHYVMVPFLFEPGEDMRLQDVTVENVRLHGEGQKDFIRLRPLVNRYMHNKVPGHVANVTFRNVALEGEPGDYLIQLTGPDAEHRVENVTLDGVSVLGKPVKADSPHLRIEENTGGIEYGPKE